MPLIESFMKYKGPVWSLFGRFLSGSQRGFDNKLDILESLHRGQRFTDFMPESDEFDAHVIQNLKDHINRDWFGLSRRHDGTWETPSDPDLDRPETIAPTGSWRGWSGNAEAIVRETVIRAIEISLGVDHIAWPSGADNPLEAYGLQRGKPSPRNWPIEFSCVGPLPWFQGAVSWSQGSGFGHTRVTWLLPNAGSGLVHDLSATDMAVANPQNPTEDGERFGNWIIGQQETRPVFISGSTPVFVSTGELVVVAPKPEHGGVVARKT